MAHSWDATITLVGDVLENQMKCDCCGKKKAHRYTDLLGLCFWCYQKWVRAGEAIVASMGEVA